MCKIRTSVMCLAVVLAPVACPGQLTGPGNPGVPWPATDALGRQMPLADEVGLPRANRTVAMFYFLWHEKSWGQGPYDVTKILATDPEAMQKNTSPPWGPLHFPHHWGESCFGYYLGDDESVLRKHAQQLADAGVDVIIFDVSNKATYRHNYTTLMRVFQEIRRQGNHTPQVAFLTPFWDPASTVRELYDQLYSQRSFEDLWFRWDGKPLILANPLLLFPNEGTAYADREPVSGDRSAGHLPWDAAVRQLQTFFTFRTPQPDYFQGPTGANQWSWLEVYPQHVFLNSRGEKEQMSVGVAQNATGDRLACMSEPGARGRSFHDGHEATEPDAVLYGHNAREQWERALKEDPQALFVTGWNEWIAGRFDEFNSVRNPPMFVDQFDHEHSRDIEPMQGGHGDNYYYQFVNYVRRYKGVPSIESVSPQSISIDGRFDDWQEVAPEFPDTVGDPVQRDHAGWGSAGPYVNHTGRNDIVAAKVSYDPQHVFFYVRTREPLSPCTDPNWMWLLLDTDAQASTGWLGYDLLVNSTSESETRTTLRQNVGGRNEWHPPISIERRVFGKEMELAIPRSALNHAQPSLQFDFKWTDNTLHVGDASDFLLNGDAAPNDRFNFRVRQAAHRPDDAVQKTK